MSRLVVIVDHDGLLHDAHLDDLRQRDLLSSHIVVRDLGGRGAEAVSDDVAADFPTRGLRTVLMVVLRVSDAEVPFVADLERDLVASLRKKTDVGRISLECGVVVIGSYASTKLFHPIWNFNVLVVPVDASGEAGELPILIDHRDEDAAIGVSRFLLMTLGVACGLFRFVESPPLIDHPSDSDNGRVRIRLLEVFVRFADAGDLVGELIQLALGGTEESWPIPAGTIELPDAAVGEFIHGIEPKVASAAGFDFRRHEFRTRSDQNIGVWTALGAFVGQILSLVRGELDDASSELRSGLSRATQAAIQAATYGGDSSIHIELDRNLSERWSTSQAQRVVVHLDRLPHLEITRPARTPAVWGALQATVLGLIDGGDFAPELVGHEPYFREQRAIIRDRSSVIPPTEELLCRNRSAAEVQAEASEEGSASKDSLWKGLILRLENSIAGSQASLAGVPKEWDLLEGEISLIQQRLGRARKLARACAVLGLLLPTLAMLDLVPHLAGVYDGRPKAVLPVLAALWLIVLATATIATRRFLQAQQDLRLAVDRAMWLVDRQANDANEFVRLSSLRWQAEDWGEILSNAAYRPLGDMHRDHRSAAAVTTGEIRGYAEAAPKIDTRARARYALKIREQVVTPGWLSRLFEVRRDTWHAGYLSISPRNSDEDTLPQFDTAAPSEGVSVPGTEELLFPPRQQFALEVSDPAILAEVQATFRNTINSNTKREAVSAIVPTVETPEGSERELRDFLNGLFENPTGFGSLILDLSAVDRSRLGLKAIKTMDAIIPFEYANGPTDSLDLSQIPDRTLFAASRVRTSNPLREGDLSILRPSAGPDDDGPGDVKDYDDF